MKSHLNGMWWIKAIMAVRAKFLPIELFVHEADYVLHISSRLPASEESESVSACCKDG
jgi:UDP-N-acetylglucosamine:LPS N-acetylglucosamine transferase